MLQDLANVGEAIGGLAVLVTLVYLAIQVRQARQELVRQNARDMVNRNNHLLTMLSNNPDLMKTYIKAVSDFDSCTREEQLAFTLWLFSWAAQSEQALLDQREGEIDGIELDGYTEGLALTLRNPGGRQAWEKLRFNFTPEFQATVDRQMVKSDETSIDRFTVPQG